MGNMKVVFLSEWWGNPYKSLLINHLSPKRVQVEEYGWTIIFLPQVIKQQKPEILHLHTLHPFFVDTRSKLYTTIKFFVFISQVLILRLIGVKIVWTVHELTDKLGRGDISQISTAILGRLFHAIITHCNTTKHEIATKFYLKNKEKIFVVPHGNYIGCYENKVSQMEARLPLGIPEDSLVFLLFGSIYRHKGALETIDAFNELQQDKVYLVIAGDPKEGLKELIIDKIKGHDNILFVPKLVPNDEIQVYMNACDCTVVPYKVFTTSGIAILAMSYGRACIAPRMGFFSDTLDDSGAFLYDPTHEEGLLNAMKCAMVNKDTLLDMGRHNLKLAEQSNWDYVSEQTLDVYKWCLDVQNKEAVKAMSC